MVVVEREVDGEGEVEGAGVVRDAARRGVDGEGIAGLAPGWLVPIDGDLGGYCGAQHWQKLTV